MVDLLSNSFNYLWVSLSSLLIVGLFYGWVSQLLPLPPTILLKLCQPDFPHCTSPLQIFSQIVPAVFFPWSHMVRADATGCMQRLSKKRTGCTVPLKCQEITMYLLYHLCTRSTSKYSLRPTLLNNTLFSQNAALSFDWTALAKAGRGSGAKGSTKKWRYNKVCIALVLLFPLFSPLPFPFC